MLRSIIIITLAVLSQSLLSAQTIVIRIDEKQTVQKIENFGASGAWFSEGIGKYWPDEKKKRMAELLFSKAFDSSGIPRGIGLSAWRFNIGGGTAEQGDSSGISNPVKRVESFLSPAGTYDWTKQSGYMWFVREAARYKVEDLIAFSNTPPVQFNSNGLGFKLEKNYKTNLREDKYGAYAGFLVDFLKHFETEGIRFKYVSPVNEPQWDWSNKFGQMNQEGSPWINKDIYRIVAALDSALRAKKSSARIIFPEAATLPALYEGQGHASRQIQQFFDKSSPLYVGKFSTLLPVAAGHSYFTDKGDSAMISVRSRLRDTAEKYGVPFWQSEYSMLADGYKEGKTGRIPAIDCALFLAKIIHNDLSVANASAWQLWNAWEPSNAALDTRYCLLALKTNPANTDGDFTITKNLWAMGHFSRFIRPGMKRVVINRSDEGGPDYKPEQDVMVSAFANNKTVVVVAINYASAARSIDLQLPRSRRNQNRTRYLTTGEDKINMQPENIKTNQDLLLPPRSISTIVIPK